MPQFHRIEDQLMERRNQAARASQSAAHPEERSFQAGYATAMADALDLVREQAAKANHPGGCARLPNPVAPARLHEQDPREILALDDDQMARDFCRLDLAEAAFALESRLMALLEDDNPLSWESYSSLEIPSLVRILKQAAQEVCRIQET